MPPAPTLEGRLLCASSCAYAGIQDGDLPDGSVENFQPGAGFIAPPTVFVSGRLNIDSCLVGATADGVVVAFRGTLPFDALSHQTLADWASDFNARPTASPDFPGAVHAGFLASVAGLWERMFATVMALRAAVGAGKPVRLTGHSKGGGMAALAAWRLEAAGVPTEVVTFAAPKPGNAAFAAAYTGRMKHVRYEYADDIVLHLPPSIGGFVDTLATIPVIGERVAGVARFDYEAVGELRFINWTGEIVPDGPALSVERRLRLVRLVAERRFGQIRADHSIACHSGYTSAVCPVGVCP